MGAKTELLLLVVGLKSYELPPIAMASPWSGYLVTTAIDSTRSSLKYS